MQSAAAAFPNRILIEILEEFWIPLSSDLKNSEFRCHLIWRILIRILPWNLSTFPIGKNKWHHNSSKTIYRWNSDWNAKRSADAINFSHQSSDQNSVRIPLLSEFLKNSDDIFSTFLVGKNKLLHNSLKNIFRLEFWSKNKQQHFQTEVWLKCLRNFKIIWCICHYNFPPVFWSKLLKNTVRIPQSATAAFLTRILIEILEEFLSSEF